MFYAMLLISLAGAWLGHNSPVRPVRLGALPFITYGMSKGSKKICSSEFPRHLFGKFKFELTHAAKPENGGL
jgi:hypothetical protein